MTPRTSSRAEIENIAAKAKRARALTKLSSAQRELGAFPNALGPAQEAVDLYRSLVNLRGETYRPEFASALDHLSLVQADLKHHEAALVSAMEVMDTYRNLVRSKPETYLPRFAMTLNHLSRFLRELGRHKEALPLAQNALEWLWPHYERFPEVHQQQMSSMFSVLAGLHEDLGSGLDGMWNKRLEQVAARAVGADPKPRPQKSSSKKSSKKKK